MSIERIYICQICNTTPDQISHHKTHIESQKHKDKREILKLKLSKLSESGLIEEYHPSNIDEIISNKETFYEMATRLELSDKNHITLLNLIAK